MLALAAYDTIRRAMATRRTVYARLSASECLTVEQLLQGIGVPTRSAVIEEALRIYLPEIARSGSYISRPLPPLPPKKQDPSQRLRMYVIRADIANELRKLCREHGWRQSELVRHALAALAIKVGIETEG